MRDEAGFDDYAEYCECGVAHCDGSCRSQCDACLSYSCRGECCDDDSDLHPDEVREIELQQEEDELLEERQTIEHRLEGINRRLEIIRAERTRL